MDTSLLPPENLLHCIKESSGHRLCPQTRFRSPEKSTQRDSFRLQCTNVCVSAFAFRCLCVSVLLCACACMHILSCLLMCVSLCVWVYSLCVCVCVSLLLGLSRCFIVFENLCISIRYFSRFCEHLVTVRNCQSDKINSALTQQTYLTV